MLSRGRARLEIHPEIEAMLGIFHDKTKQAIDLRLTTGGDVG